MLEQAGEELQPQHVPRRGVDEPFVETSGLHVIHHREVGLAVGQLQVNAGGDRESRRLVHRTGDLVPIGELLDRVVVGDDKSLESPFLPQDALQQKLARRRRDAVDFVVRRHH